MTTTAYTLDDLTTYRETQEIPARFLQHVTDRSEAYLDVISGDHDITVLNVNYKTLLDARYPYVAVTAAYKGRHSNSRFTSTRHVPFSFIFDQDGTYEDKIKQLRDLQTELGIPTSRQAYP